MMMITLKDQPEKVSATSELPFKNTHLHSIFPPPIQSPQSGS